jgi:hypothetical protein
MGAISKKLASRFRKARRRLGELRRQAVSQFLEFGPYCQVVGPAQDEYLPSTALPGKLPWIVRKLMNDAGKGSRMTTQARAAG